MSDLESAFTRIYDENLWDGGSGPGSNPRNAAGYLAELQRVIDGLGVSSVLDVGCGDFRLGAAVDWRGAQYTGIDVVRSVVERCREEHGSERMRFLHRDFTRCELPPADLLICKDVLQHLESRDAAALLRQLGKYKYALITNDVGSNQNRSIDNEARYAPLDLEQRPFGLRAKVLCQTRGKRTLLWSRDEDAGAHAGEPWGAAPNFGGEHPNVLVAVLAKQAEPFLPFWLACLGAQDYPKHRMHLWIRTNNNTDETAKCLRWWLMQHGREYGSVTFDDSDVEEPVHERGLHEWTPERFRVLGQIRQQSLHAAIALGCEFYFCADVDNFLRPGTLSSLVGLDLPIVAPFLRHEHLPTMYSNFHYDVDSAGYFAPSPHYDALVTRAVRGVVEVKVAHCAYLVRTDVAAQLRYDDGSGRHEYVVFSESARKAGVPQYLDNRRIYGYVHLDDVWSGASMRYLRDEVLGG